MTTGVPIYLVSACTTGEEFVAAFRRYADRGSLFVPIAEPIPAGRRGRFALTLAGGGVLIEGEADVISSSKVPSILHGRVGMTLRFGELDDNSKTVLIELEKARLAAKPPAPSVAPRVVELPAGPRPKPPAASVRIDATIALAECTALGDLEALEKTTATPPKAGPKFVVPSVPPVGTPRPKTPSTPPELRPRTPSGPVPVVRPKTPSVPPAMPSLTPLPKSPSGPVKMPAPPSGLSATLPAVSIADLKPEKKPLDVALADAGAAIEGAKTTTMDVPPAPMTPRTLEAVEGPTMTLTPTQMAAVPPPPITGQRQAAMTPTELSTVPAPPTTQPGVAPRAAQPTPSTPESLLTTIRSGPPANMPSPGSKDWMLTTVKGTAPPPASPLPRPPIVGSPAPKPLEPDLDEPTDLTAMPIIPDDTGRKTSLGVAAIMREPASMTPSAPLPLVPVPQVDPNDDAPVEIEDLDTSVTEQPDEVRSIPVEPPVVAAAKPAIKPTVEEPTPSGDWTITPGEAPTIKPRVPEPAAEGLAPVAQAEEEKIAPPPTRITGNWTIQLDSSSPDGWSEPSKVDATALPASVVADLEKPKKKKERTKPTPETPPELRPVARSIVMDALHTPPPAVVTPSEEPKVQIDPTLMEAPIVDPDYGASASMSAVAPPATLSALMPAQAPPPHPAQSAHALPAQSGHALQAAPPPIEHMRLATPIPGSMAPMVPIDRPTPTPLGIDPRGEQLTPGPRVTPVPGVAPPLAVSPAELVSLPTPPPGRMVTDGGVGFFRESGDIANLAGSGSFPVGDSTSLVDARRRRRLVVIGISAAVAVALGIVMVIALAGGDKKTEDPVVKAPADAAPVVVATPDAAQVVVATPDAAEMVAKDATPIVEPPTRCKVEVTSVPAGADVLVQGSKEVLGTTPATLELPCGNETRLLVRKTRFSSVVRPVTPTEEGAKLRVALAKLMYSVKVSSSPAGASISVNGKSVAVTPTTMKLPAFETSTVTFSKEGYNVESQKVTPKQNNQTVHAQLKKKRR